MKKMMIAAAAMVCALASPAFAANHIVTQVGFTFSPANVVINAGDTVQWVWANGIHTVTEGVPCTPAGGGFNMPLSIGNPGPSMMFNTVGTVDYFCIPHCGIGMTGQITVNVAPPVVPTMSEWGLIVMALLTLTGGTLVIRKATARRTATA